MRCDDSFNDIGLTQTGREAKRKAAVASLAVESRSAAVGRPSLRQPARRLRASEAGFTLVEVLIAVAIVALTAVLGYRAIAALSESETRLSAEATRWGQLDAFFTRLEADLRQAVPRSARLAAARQPAWLGTVDSQGNALLEFSRAGPEFNIEPGSAGQRLGYRLRDGMLEVLYWPGYDRPRGQAPSGYALLTEVGRFRLWYLAANGAWIPEWPATGEAAIPRAVRVELTLASGDVIERWLALR